MNRLETIVIRTIPHADQRYNTLGDWQYRDDNSLIITVSETGDWKSNVLIAIHEFVEVVLCQERGVSQEVVDHFDTHEGKESNDPGDLPNAPYRDEHCFAMSVERMVCAAMGMAWAEHEQNCDRVSP